MQHTAKRFFYPKIIISPRSDVTITRLIVGKRQCPVLMVRLRSLTTVGNINSNATGFNIKL
jgi:hypothetical protein